MSEPIVNTPPQFTQLSTKVLRPRLACIGMIKIGAKGERRQSGRGVSYGLPTKLDHFRVTTRARDSKTDNYVLDQAVHERIGARPNELNIRFLFDEPEQNFHASLSAYQKGLLMCQGNGEKAYDRLLGRQIPCTCPLLGKQHKGEYPPDIKRPGGVTCKPHGALSVLLDDASDYGGFHLFQTTSWETIAAITEALKLFKTQFGMLSFIPFKLKLYPRTVHYEQGKETKTATAYSVTVTLRASMDVAFQIAAGAREQRAAALQLSAGEVYTPEQHVQVVTDVLKADERDISAEFHPEQEDGETNYEIVEDDTPDPLIERIRVAYELSGKDVVYTNRKLAEFEGKTAELATLFQNQLADIWARAGEELERRSAAAETKAAPADGGADNQPAAAGAAPLSLFD